VSSTHNSIAIVDKAAIWRESERVVRLVWVRDHRVTEQDWLKQDAAILSLTGGNRFRLLYDARCLTTLTHSTRMTLATSRFSCPPDRVAIVMRSNLAVWFDNIALKWAGSRSTKRCFRSSDEAQKWLEQTLPN